MNSEVLSYADLAALEKKEREELERTKKVLEETKAVLADIEKWWKDSSQANFVLTSRLQTAESEMNDIIKEERRQKEIWKEAYESVTGSRSWKMISKMKRLVGKK